MNLTSREKGTVMISKWFCIYCVERTRHADLVRLVEVMYCSVSQLPGRGPVLGSGINYAGSREVVLEFRSNFHE